MPRLARLLAVATLSACAALLTLVAPKTSSHANLRAPSAKGVATAAASNVNPLLIYSTFLGGDGGGPEGANAIAVDSVGGAYVVGRTASSNFPVTNDAMQKVYAGPAPDPNSANGNVFTGDAFVTRLTPDGSGLDYSTYIGGGGQDAAMGIALDALNNAFVTGQTLSPNFPVTPGAFDTTCGTDGNCNSAPNMPPFYDAFALKLNAYGSGLFYSTYLGGGSQEPVQSQTNLPDFQKMGIAIDAQGDAFVTSSTLSQDFPVTAGAFRTAPETGFVTKLNPTGTGLVYSTYFPGAADTALALDASGDAYLTGMAGDASSSPKTLPVVNAYQPTIGGTYTFDSFAAKLDSSGSSVLFSTFLGGAEGSNTPRNGDDVGYGVGLDAAGNVYVSGTTRSGCFPSSNPYVAPSGPDCTSSGKSRAFLAKFSPGGNSLLFSRKLNDAASSGGAMSVAPSGVSTVATTCATAQQNSNVCVYKVSPEGQLLFTTMLTGSNGASVNGVATDAAGNIYVAGRTNSPDYPVTAAAFQKTFGGGSMDAFVSKLTASLGVAQFAAASSNASEAAHKATVQVERSGDLSGEFSVDYATSDGTASSLSDYTAASGTLHFAPFETTKTIDIFITDDAFGPEGDETFSVTLSNPKGSGVVGTSSSTTVHITDNDAAAGPNPVAPASFDVDFFVRQHYVDFLGREPDSAGFEFWKNEITQCGADAQCAEVKRINVSAAFFYSIEFQNTGYLVERTYKAAYGDKTSPGVAGTVPIVSLGEFQFDTHEIGQGIVVGQGNWRPQLDANKDAYFAEFVTRQRFIAAAPTTLTPAQFVDALFANASVTPTAAERQAAIDEFGGAANTTDNAARARALRRVAENPTLNQREFNRAFVLMQYFGYLRRNPDAAPDGDFRGWKFWLTKLEQFNGNFVAAEMVKAFINSNEYIKRFGP